MHVFNVHAQDVRQGFKAVRSWRAPTFTLTCCSLPPGSTVGAQVLAHAAHVAHAAEQQELLLVGGADGCIRLYSWDEPGVWIAFCVWRIVEAQLRIQSRSLKSDSISMRAHFNIPGTFLY